jgi:predicted Zn-dependent protease
VSAGEGANGMHARDAAAGAAAGEAVAARVLDLVRARAASAEAETVVHTGVSALTRFANGAIHQNVAEDVSHVALRIALDGRVAAAALDGPADDVHLERLVAGVFAAAAVSPVDADWPGLAGPEAAPAVDHWDDATAAATPDERAEGVAAFVGAAAGLVTAGALSTDARHIAFANSAGQALAGRLTWATVDGIARTPTSDGVARQSSAALGGLDARAAGETAARKARDSADATDLAPGRYEVVLEPSCVSNIIGFLVNYGFGGRAVEEGRSFVRLGEQQLDRAFSLRDDVTHPGMIGVGFDPEGTPRRPIDLVRAGVPTAILHDRRTARRAGTVSTGAGVLGANTWGLVPACGVVTPGDASLDELVASVERGILVTDFWYTRVLDPRTVVVTGLTRNGVWLIEDGRVSRAVTNLRFTQSFPESLAPGAVLGIGRDLGLFPDEDEGALLVPSLRLASWNFSGGAKG